MAGQGITPLRLYNLLSGSTGIPVSASYAVTSSYASTVQSGSVVSALSASYAISASGITSGAVGYVNSSSYAVTSSFASTYPLPLFATQSGDMSNAFTTYMDSSMSFSLAAATQYEFRFVVGYTAPVTSTGIGFGISTGSAVGDLFYGVMGAYARNAIGGSSFQQSFFTKTNQTNLTNFNIEQANEVYLTIIEGHIKTIAAAALKLSWRSEVAAVTKISSGSYGMATPVQLLPT